MSLWTFRIKHSADAFDCARLVIEAGTKEEAIAIARAADERNEEKRKTRTMDWSQVLQWDPDKVDGPVYVDVGYNY